MRKVGPENVKVSGRVGIRIQWIPEPIDVLNLYMMNVDI